MTSVQVILKNPKGPRRKLRARQSASLKRKFLFGSVWGSEVTRAHTRTDDRYTVRGGLGLSEHTTSQI